MVFINLACCVIQPAISEMGMKSGRLIWKGFAVVWQQNGRGIFCLHWYHNVGMRVRCVSLASGESAPWLWVVSVGWLRQAFRLTKRAPDEWDSARFVSWFKRKIWFRLATWFSPLAGNAGRWTN